LHSLPPSLPGNISALLIRRMPCFWSCFVAFSGLFFDLQLSFFPLPKDLSSKQSGRHVDFSLQEERKEIPPICIPIWSIGWLIDIPMAKRKLVSGFFLFFFFF
jgi:hypothetical protein